MLAGGLHGGSHEGRAGRQEAYDLASADVPLRRAGTADEMAFCCLFLASDESSIVSGTTLVADELTSRMFAT